MNAVIAGDLSAEVGLTAADLGLLTSTYFLVFSLVVLPCGVLIDRYGPRLVDSALLLGAAAGSLLFALADGVWSLMLGRALIGLGVAVALMAGLKAIVMWFPPERVALANGWYIMLGALGALSATGPAELIVQALGWRGLFAVLAAASATVALLILLVVPEKDQARSAAASPNISFLAIFGDPRFVRIAPLAAIGIGTSFSLQGLWAAPWLTNVAGLDRPAVVEHLTLMAAALAASALALGALAERLRRAGISTEMFLAGTLALSMAAQLALLLDLPVPSHLLFVAIASGGATNVLSFAILARYFPKEVAGRANAALGVLNMGAAFCLQSLSGFIIALWPADGGHYPAEAHQAALGLNLVLQAAAFVWFIRPERKTALQHLPAHPIHPLAASLGVAPTAALSYARARHAWSLKMARARAQEKAWRSAAFASFAVLALLVSSLGSTILGTSVAAHVIEGAQPTATRNFAGGDPQRSKPSFILDRPAEILPASLALSPLVRPDPRREPW